MSTLEEIIQDVKLMKDHLRVIDNKLEYAGEQALAAFVAAYNAHGHTHPLLGETSPTSRPRQFQMPAYVPGKKPQAMPVPGAAQQPVAVVLQPAKKAEPIVIVRDVQPPMP